MCYVFWPRLSDLVIDWLGKHTSVVLLLQKLSRFLPFCLTINVCELREIEMV